MLKPTNYSLWEIQMQIILEANGLWEMIEPNEKTQAENKKDKTAMEDETIDTFTTKLSTVVNKAASLGHTMKDEELVRKLLNAVPDRVCPNVNAPANRILGAYDLEIAIPRAVVHDDDKTSGDARSWYQEVISADIDKWLVMLTGYIKMLMAVVEIVLIWSDIFSCYNESDSRWIRVRSNNLASRLLGAYDLEIAIPRAIVHDDDKTSGDAMSWYMI
nr:hypothetical protein [Tanacetum cinerariifolium]